MMNLVQLQDFLNAQGAAFTLIAHQQPILMQEDASQLFDLRLSAMALVVRADDEWMAILAPAGQGWVDLHALANRLGVSKLKLADRTQAEQCTGYKVGAMPLVGLDLPCLFDHRLLAYDFIYGGSGDEHHTLQIAPADVQRLNRTILTY